VTVPDRTQVAGPRPATPPGPDRKGASSTRPAPVAAMDVEPEQQQQVAPRQDQEPSSSQERQRKTFQGSEEVLQTTVVESEVDKDEKKRQRSIERRRKLATYLAEELAGVFGKKKNRYIEDMKWMLQGASDASRDQYWVDKLDVPSAENVAERVPKILGPSLEAPEFGGWHSEQVSDRMAMVGEVGPSRQAWCRWWDESAGCGELVDLDDQLAVAVVSSALQTGANVSPRLKYLRHGEFVEYRRVDIPNGHRAVLVRGIKGWPLMCEVGDVDLPSM